MFKLLNIQTVESSNMRTAKTLMLALVPLSVFAYTTAVVARQTSTAN
ncbi:hypothetical protein ALO43_200048 [Pseudomonas tremae]|uniref:Conjugal transfer protein n=1 Tax=Pseudomonas tremae TaxID=200454 RepID=A0AA40P4W1_9PSED|nr:hypothetical protein ALO43_200048 [Pseudomonas tremae]